MSDPTRGRIIDGPTSPSSAKTDLESVSGMLAGMQEVNDTPMPGTPEPQEDAAETHGWESADHSARQSAEEGDEPFENIHDLVARGRGDGYYRFPTEEEKKAAKDLRKLLQHEDAFSKDRGTSYIKDHGEEATIHRNLLTRIAWLISTEIHGLQTHSFAFGAYVDIVQAGAILNETTDEIRAKIADGTLETMKVDEFDSLIVTESLWAHKKDLAAQGKLKDSPLQKIADREDEAES